MISVIAFALIAAILAVILKQYRPEYAMILTVAAGCGILLLIVSTVMPVLDQAGTLIERTGIDSTYFAVLVKALGLCYLTQFAADLCNDAGQTSLAGKIELAGKTAVVLLALPVITGLVELILTLIE